MSWSVEGTSERSRGRRRGCRSRAACKPRIAEHATDVSSYLLSVVAITSKAFVLVTSSVSNAGNNGGVVASVERDLWVFSLAAHL